MCAYVSDFDSLVCREQVCALFARSFNCFLTFSASYSAPNGHLITESIGVIKDKQVLHGVLQGNGIDLMHFINKLCQCGIRIIFKILLDMINQPKLPNFSHVC